VKLQSKATARSIGHGAFHADRNARPEHAREPAPAPHAHDVVGSTDRAECAIDGLYVAIDGQHADGCTTADHRQPHGSSF
jgi:hypothetical protein